MHFVSGVTSITWDRQCWYIDAFVITTVLHACPSINILVFGECFVNISLFIIEFDDFVLGVTRMESFVTPKTLSQ